MIYKNIFFPRWKNFTTLILVIEIFLVHLITILKFNSHRYDSTPLGGRREWDLKPATTFADFYNYNNIRKS